MLYRILEQFQGMLFHPGDIAPADAQQLGDFVLRVDDAVDQAVAQFQHRALPDGQQMQAFLFCLYFPDAGGLLAVRMHFGFRYSAWTSPPFRFCLQV